MARAGTPSRLAAGVAAAAVLVAGGAGFAGGRTSAPESEAVTVASGDEHEHEPGSVEAIAEELKEGQERERAALAADLGEAATAAQEDMGAALRGMSEAVPVRDAGAGGPAPTAATPEQAASWAAQAQRAAEVLAAVGEGTSDLTVTREALRGAATMLGDAATDYASALQAAGGDRAAAAEELSVRRDDAVRLWQAGATELDTVVVEAGQDHVHLFLDPSGDPDAVPLEFREPEAPEASDAP